MGCSIDRIPIPHGDEHKRLLVRVAIPELTGFYQPTVHYDCIHNQLQSIRNRVCGVVPRPSEAGITQMRLAVRTLTATLPPTYAESIYALPNRHVGAKRLRYLAAARDLEVYGLSKSDSNIKMFVKAERFDPSAKVNPDPRAVQFRGAKYCVALSAYLRPVEELLYQTDRASSGVPRTRNVAKGLNSVDRAHLLAVKLSAFDRPAIVSIDASRFDKHVSQEHLRIEHSVYLASNPDATFRSLLMKQLVNKCFTTLGIKYTVAGRRMSGDMNTAIGNIVLMLVMMIAAMVVMGITKWDCLDDGDDILVIVEWEDVTAFCRRVPDVFLEYGMEVKVDDPVDKIAKVVFCKSQVVEFAPGKLKFVRNWTDVVCKALCGVRNWTNKSFRSRVLNAIGTCELILNLGVPILQEFAMAVLRNTKRGTLMHAPDGLRARAQRDAKHLGVKDMFALQPQSIHPIARASFADAFGVEPARQVHLERWFSAWTFDVESLHVRGEEIIAADWTCAQSIEELYRCME